MAEENNLFDMFMSREVQTMEIFLFAKASRAAISIEEYINTRLVQGVSADVLEKDLIDDLENGGRIFQEFNNAIRVTANGVIQRSRDNALFADPDKTIEQAEYRWVAVLVNTCEDCLERHGKAKTYLEWEAEGLPRTGATVCRENCKCILLPADTAVIDPISRKRT